MTNIQAKISQLVEVKMTPSHLQTWKMSEILPKQDCSVPDFTRKCVNYVNFKIATKQRNLSANTMFTTFTSLHHVYLIITNKKNTTRLVFGYPAGVTLPKLGNFTQAW